METEKITQNNEKTDKAKSETAVQKSENKLENKGSKPTEVKKEEKKPESPKIVKTEAVVNARSLPISTKYAIAICNMIRNKNLDYALERLELAEKMKIPVPMRGEIPHKKGIMSGRYPVKALGHFIKVLKSLKSNALVNELELEKYKLFCKANVASRPYRRFGKGKFKRTHVTVKLIRPTKKVKKSK